MKKDTYIEFKAKLNESEDSHNEWADKQYEIGYDHGYEGKPQQLQNRHYIEGHKDGTADKKRHSVKESKLVESQHPSGYNQTHTTTIHEYHPDGGYKNNERVRGHVDVEKHNERGVIHRYHVKSHEHGYDLADHFNAQGHEAEYQRLKEELELNESHHPADYEHHVTTIIHEHYPKHMKKFDKIRGHVKVHKSGEPLHVFHKYHVTEHEHGYDMADDMNKSGHNARYVETSV